MINIYGDTTINGRMILTTPPSSPNDAVSLSYIQSLISSSKTLGPCQIAVLSNIPLSGLSTIQSYPINSGDRILVTSQGNANNNGVYTASSGAWARAADFAAGIDGSNTLASIINGDSSGLIFKSQSTSFTVGSAACYFTALGASNNISSYTFRTINSSGNILANDIYILADCSASAITLTLPVSTSVSSSSACKIFRVIKTDNTVNSLTITTTSPDSFLDGRVLYVTNVPGRQIDLIALFTLSKYSVQ
jgi:subtilisin family serine protease